MMLRDFVVLDEAAWWYQYTVFLTINKKFHHGLVDKAFRPWLQTPGLTGRLQDDE